MATHSSVLAWRIPGTGEPGGLPSMGSHRVGHDWSDLAAAAHIFYWWAIARQRGNSKIAPWEKFHRPLEMCQTRSLTFKPNLLDKQIDLSLRKTAGGRGGGGRVVSVCYSCSALGVVICPEVSLWLLQLHWTENASPSASRARWSRNVPWLQLQKLGNQICRSCSPGDADTLERSRGECEDGTYQRKRKKKKKLQVKWTQRDLHQDM